MNRAGFKLRSIEEIYGVTVCLLFPCLPLSVKPVSVSLTDTCLYTCLCACLPVFLCVCVCVCAYVRLCVSHYVLLLIDKFAYNNYWSLWLEPLNLDDDARCLF